MRRIIYTIVSGAFIAALAPGAVSAAPLHPNAFDRPGAEQPGATLEYDSANRLRRVKRGSLDIRYLYDALGNLEAEIVDDGVTVKRTDLMVDESGPLPRIVGALTDDGAKELYAYGPMGLAMVRKTSAGQAGGTTYHALTDELGTVRGLADGTGALAGRIAYGPFGRVRVTEGEQTRLAFAGEYRDTAGLIWLRARHYAPFLGRFLQRDTVVDDPGNPQTLNRYAYAANNPLSNLDPSGHYVESAIDLASLGMGAASIASWDDDTDLGTRLLDVGGVALDLVSLALPLIPGGASAVLAATRLGKAADGVRSASAADGSLDEALEALSVNTEQVANKAVTRQLGIIDQKFVDDIVKRVDNMTNPEQTDIDIDIAGSWLTTTPNGRILPKKSVTLGEAHEISRWTGREVALVWDKWIGSNLLTIGTADSAPIRDFGDRSRVLIYHTHLREIGSLNDQIRHLPSAEDRQVIAATGQLQSFIVPLDVGGITKFGQL